MKEPQRMERLGIKSKYMDDYIEYISKRDPNLQIGPTFTLTWAWARDTYLRGKWTKEEFIDQAWCLAMSNFDMVKIIKEKK